MKLLKAFSIYTIGSLFTQGVNFLLIPVFTRYLTPNDYGILSLIGTITSFLSPVVLLSIDGSISIEYYKNKFNNFSSYTSSALLGSFISFIVVLGLMLIISPLVQKELLIPKFWLNLIPLLCFLEVVKGINLTLFQVQEKPFNYALFSFSNTLFSILLSLLFVVLMGYNYTGRLYGQYIVAFLYSLLGIYLLKKKGLLTISINKAILKDIFHFGIPLIPHVIGFSIINLADRFFISHYVGNDELGKYSLGYTIGSVILLIALAFNNAWTPNFYALLNENTNNSKIKIVKITYVYIIVLLLLTITLITISPLIFKVFIGARFYSSINFVPWIAFSSFFFGCYLAFTNYIFYLKKTSTFAYISIINIFLNLLLNYFLIQRYGAIGAAYATFFSFLFFSVIVMIIAVSLYPMPWSIKIKKMNYLI